MPAFYQINLIISIYSVDVVTFAVSAIIKIMNGFVKLIAGLVFAGAGYVLIPWTHYLWRTLPSKYDTTRWRQAWVGLDVMLIITLMATGIFLLRESVWAIITGSMAGSLLLVDAWFDVMTAKPGKTMRSAVLLALFIEIPVAVFCFTYIAMYLQDHLI